MDECQNCIIRGNFDACKKEICSRHETWYAKQLQAQSAALVETLEHTIDLLEDVEQAFPIKFDTIKVARAALEAAQKD